MGKQNNIITDCPEITPEIERKMRILANYLIDRVLEEQQKAIKKGLNINLEKVNLIMEHKI